MARFYGEIGFGDTVEVEPGVWEDTIVEHKFFGSVPRNTQRFKSGNDMHDEVSLNPSISIVANKFAFDNLKNINYIRFEGDLWEIDSIEVKRPRLILSLGGVYNGPTPTTSSTA